jgi:hypothetical protein
MYGDEMTSYKVHNNVQVVHEKRFLVIEIFEGLKTDPVLPAKLGSFRIKMSSIDNDCPIRGWGATTATTTTTTDSSLEFAEIEIEMRVIDDQPSYYIGKSKQASDQIALEVEQIERFNDDQKQSSNSCKLTANIRGINRISLLHAAVHLNNLDLLERVLRLGANPLLRSTMGSALAYAQQLRDRANEKAMKASSSDDPDAGRREGELAARQEFLAGHSKVVEMLRSAAHANESQSSPIGPESTVTASTTSCEQKSDDNGEDLHGDIAEDADLHDDDGGEASALAGSSSNDSDTGAASKAELEIAEQQVADAKILREIMRRAPPGAGGVPNGSRCHKAHIGSQLRTGYLKQFPDRDSSRAFLRRVIDSGIVKEVTSGTISTYYFDSPDPTPHHDQPPLQNPGVSYDDLYGDVMVEGNAIARSPSSDSPTPSTSKPRTDTTAASKPHPETPAQRSEQQIDDAKIILIIMKDAQDTAGGEDGYQCNKSFVGNQLGSRFANLFPDRDSVRNFMRRAIASGMVKEKGTGGNVIWHFANSDATGNHSRRPSLTSKSYPQQEVRLPALSGADFSILYHNVSRCKKGDGPGQCWHKDNGGCHFWHISRLFGTALIDDESKFVGAHLPILDPLAVTVVTRRLNGLDYATATYLDNKKKMIYFAEGGPLSQMNDQMAFWYPTPEAAVAALQRVVFLRQLNRRMN